MRTPEASVNTEQTSSFRHTKQLHKNQIELDKHYDKMREMCVNPEIKLDYSLLIFSNDGSHRHDARPPHARYGDRRDARTAYCFVLCVSTLNSIQTEKI